MNKSKNVDRFCFKLENDNVVGLLLRVPVPIYTRIVGIHSFGKKKQPYGIYISPYVHISIASERLNIITVVHTSHDIASLCEPVGQRFLLSAARSSLRRKSFSREIHRLYDYSFFYDDFTFLMKIALRSVVMYTWSWTRYNNSGSKFYEIFTDKSNIDAQRNRKCN